MKALAGFGLVFLAASCAYGQLSAAARSGFGSVVFPGQGHPPVARNVFSVTNLNFGRNLGAVVRGTARGPYRPGRSGTPLIVPYAYPVYAGYGAGYYGYPEQQAQPNTVVVYPPQQPPVVINQTFTEPPAHPVMQEVAPETNSSSDAVQVYQAPSNTPAETAPASQNDYYLIAFKDHSIYSAVGYWVDGDTLHYITTGNTHNQASLSLVDRKLTEELNRGRGVDVRLPSAR